MPEQLLAAVRDLTEVVRRLENALNEYPKRTEVEDKFATKAESRERGMKYLTIGLVMILISFFASVVVTVTTVSTCFTSPEARRNNAAGICQSLPGYSETQAENAKILRDFRKLLQTPENNTKRLDRIERKLNLPPLETE